MKMRFTRSRSEIKEKDFAGGKSFGAMGRDDSTGRPIYAQEILVTKTVS